jgi:hypothetical protein
MYGPNQIRIVLGLEPGSAPPHAAVVLRSVIFAWYWSGIRFVVTVSET